MLELDQVEIFNFTEQLLPSQELQASFKSSPAPGKELAGFKQQWLADGAVHPSGSFHGRVSERRGSNIHAKMLKHGLETSAKHIATGFQ